MMMDDFGKRWRLECFWTASDLARRWGWHDFDTRDEQSLCEHYNLTI